ncbi:methyltransferase [Flavobacterium sp.]|uniref:methyltransferase n=1 Tax=Flavobacterium sp. TaxID=239 RepID=UPI002638E2D2|nr:methyltransferase [Flavobacterium sp.]
MKDKLKSFFTEHWNYMAVSTACKLGVFEALEQQDLNPKELADCLNLQEKQVTMLLNVLRNIDFLKEENGMYSLSKKSLLLTENHPESLKYACLNWSGEHWNAWQDLEYSIQTGASSFTKLYGENYFDYLNNHPDKLNQYHKAMYEYARDDYKELPNKIDLSIANSVIDIGGGYGAAISAIKTFYPNLTCYLFDLEKVIDKANKKDVLTLKGNFFEAIPKVAEVQILSRILHDWNNEKAAIILKNCFDALPKNGTLYIIENCSDKIAIDLSLLSLNMTVICESYERTSVEYIQTVTSVGFTFESDIKLNELQTILKFKK